MRREIARRGAGRRRGWKEAAPGFGEDRELVGEEWGRKRRPRAAAAISEEGRGSGERKLVGIVVGWVTAT
jgi:hypothetical protein